MVQWTCKSVKYFFFILTAESFIIHLFGVLFANHTRLMVENTAQSFSVTDSSGVTESTFAVFFLILHHLIFINIYDFNYLRFL